MKQLPAFQILNSIKEKDEDPSVVFELSNLEYSAIGMVTVQWSYLEHLLLLVHQMMCECFNEKISDDATSFNFKRRLRSWFDFLKAHEKETKNTEFFLSIHQRIANLMHERHKIIHGMWDYDPANPFSLKLFSTRSNATFEKPSNIDVVYKLATEIGKVNCILSHIPIGNKRVIDLAQTGVVTDNEGMVGHMHRAMFLPEAERERLFPEMSFKGKK